MKLQPLSILPAHSPKPAQEPAQEPACRNSTAEELEPSSGGEAASYSARYQVFLAQQTARNQPTNRQVGLEALSGLGRVLADLALFIAFFLGFLTLFGFGLSRLNGRLNLTQSNVSAAAKEAATPQPGLPESSAPPKKKQINK